MDAEPQFFNLGEINMLDQILGFVSSLSGQATIGAIIVEFAFRLVKSDKPLSIAHIAAASLHKIADICAGIANFADKILPQKLK